MADDDDETDDDGEEDFDVAAALGRLRDGREATLGDVLGLLDKNVLPQVVIDAAGAVFETQRDVANGGMDQVAWNHGALASREYAKAWLAVGAIENGELMTRLADALEAYYAEHPQAEITADPVKHFSAYRKSVSGPYFNLPDPQVEVGEVLVEYVVEHASELRNPEPQ